MPDISLLVEHLDDSYGGAVRRILLSYCTYMYVNQGMSFVCTARLHVDVIQSALIIESTHKYSAIRKST